MFPFLTEYIKVKGCRLRRRVAPSSLRNLCWYLIAKMQNRCKTDFFGVSSFIYRFIPIECSFTRNSVFLSYGSRNKPLIQHISYEKRLVVYSKDFLERGRICMKRRATFAWCHSSKSEDATGTIMGKVGERCSRGEWSEVGHGTKAFTQYVAVTFLS